MKVVDLGPVVMTKAVDLGVAVMMKVDDLGAAVTRERKLSPWGGYDSGSCRPGASLQVKIVQPGAVLTVKVDDWTNSLFMATLQDVVILPLV